MKQFLKTKFNKEQKKKYLAGIILSLVASFMVCFYAPLELFSTNLDEFLFDSSLLIPVIFRTFIITLAISLVVMMLLYLINEKVYFVGLVAYFALFIITYIQGNFMAGKLPVLDGTPVDWSKYRKENIKSIVMYVIIVAIITLVIKKFKSKGFYSFVCVMSSFIFAILSVSLFVVYFSKGADKKTDNSIFIDGSNLMEMSEDENFVILLLDCVDARELTKLMDKHPEYNDLFEDFTYYTNTMSVYPYTTQSIPYILTGKWYENECSYKDYNVDAYNESPLFAELENRGYSIDLYENDLPQIQNTSRYGSVLVADSSSVDYNKFAKLELKATGYKYLPYYLKEICEYDNTDFRKIRDIKNGDDCDETDSKIDVEEYEHFSDVDDEFYKNLKETEVTLKEQKSFKFIHIEGGHSPYRYNAKVERIEDATYETNLQATLTITEEYLNKLKKSGVYDNSVIIVMSDHGYEGGKAQGVDRQNPILFVKGRGEKHALQKDDAPISHEDLQDAYVKLLDGASGDEIFDYKEGDERERRYLLYALRDKDHMYEYIQYGHASDMSSMKETGKVFVRKKESGLSEAIGAPFKTAIKWIYDRTHNMAVAIILFTLLTKIILLPVSIWVQFNSIKMVKMQPELNRINAKYYGDKETISEKQAELFKKEKYNPLISIIPMAIQLVLLMVVIAAIKSVMSSGVNINTMFFEMDLRTVPNKFGGVAILSPIVAAFSAWIMCYTQNKSNVLQSEQGKFGQYGAMILSVGLSLYLGWFVTVGVVVYWVASNLMSVAQMYILNFFINPKKFVNYEELELSKQELGQLKTIGNEEKSKEAKKYAKREKEDYKRFFSIVNKHLVFYSENTGFYKYYKGIIEYLLEHTNLNIHYITSDPNDAIFELAKKEEKIKPYYIAEKRLITLFMKMEADVVVMTMPDLENFHIKRSYVRNDIQYIFIPHSMDSLNMTMRTSCMDHYDSVLCVGPHQKEEIEKNEIAYKTKKKELIDWGYSLLDEMIEDYNNRPKVENEQKMIMIAPSWQDDNIVDSCLEEVLDELKEDKFKVIVRPHPQHVRHRKEKMEQLKARFADNDNIEIQTDFSSNSDVFSADLLITDWSGIAYEYAYATRKPVLHINTPMKVMNPEYQTIDTVPINILVREEIGCSVDTDKLDTLREKVNDLINRSDEFYEKIGGFIDEYVYNLGHAGEVGAKYIYSVVEKQINQRKEKEKKETKDNKETKDKKENKM